MLGLGVYRRWKLVREANEELRIAKVQAKLMGWHIAGISGPFCLEAVFRLPTIEGPMDQLGPGPCGNPITRAQFIWHGKCTECQERDKALAKRRR